MTLELVFFIVLGLWFGWRGRMTYDDVLDWLDDRKERAAAVQALLAGEGEDVMEWLLDHEDGALMQVFQAAGLDPWRFKRIPTHIEQVEEHNRRLGYERQPHAAIRAQQQQTLALQQAAARTGISAPSHPFGGGFGTQGPLGQHRPGLAALFGGALAPDATFDK